MSAVTDTMSPRQSRFFVFTQANLKRIDSLDAADLKTLRKILYVSFIDSLSGLVYPTFSQNRERFTTFVTRFSSWSNAEKVNTPHLAHALTLNPDPSYNKIRAVVLENLNSWGGGELIKIDCDLSAEVIGTHWPKGKRYEQMVDGTPWQHLKHVELLYAYRNALVHGFRPLGHDVEVPEDTEPYYLNMSETSSSPSAESDDYWELIYPTGFLRSLAHMLLDATRDHICENGIDPVAVLRGGRYWLNELNR
jgi:hypothetical protein